MISDLHLHTRLSRDARQDAENDVAGFVKAAEEKNISYIAITEHRDIMPDDPMHEGIINADLYECARQVEAEKKRLLAEGRSSVTLLHGVELAHQHTHPEESAKIIAEHNYDFILGSLHLLKDKYDFYRCDFDNLSDADGFTPMAEEDIPQFPVMTEPSFEETSKKEEAVKKPVYETSTGVSIPGGNVHPKGETTASASFAIPGGNIHPKEEKEEKEAPVMGGFNDAGFGNSFGGGLFGSTGASFFG